MKYTLLSLALFCAVSAADAQSGIRALPDDNLSYPVLVTLGNGSTGSGFYVRGESAVYLVTAKHVLFDPISKRLWDKNFELRSYSSDLSDHSANLYAVDLGVLAPENLSPHPSQDIAVVKLFSFTPEPAGRTKLSPYAGVSVKENSKTGLVHATLETLHRFNQVLVGNEVMVLGYPTSLGLQNMPQIDSRSPLLRKGIVAGQNIAKHTIILDCPVYPGNSGGPVIEIDNESLTRRRYWIIGVVSEFVPYTDSGKTFFMVANSGYSIVTPIDFALELIK